MAKRIRPKATISFAASHGSMTSHPTEIVKLIEQAMGVLSLAPIGVH